jgi:hypothetical protein
MTRQGLSVMAILFFVLGSVVSAQAADLQDSHVGSSCGGVNGDWHFVNNQTGGAGAGTLTAMFTNGTCTVGAAAVSANTQHFFCVGFGPTLIDASTNLQGKLVLSDFTCDTKEPPPCDPKKEICK